MSQGWIGVDLDGTLAHSDAGSGPMTIGEPIPKMVDRVKRWLKEGKDVRIVTARMSHNDPGLRRSMELAIRHWCNYYLGTVLPVTCCKDYQMIELWDDRAVQVIPNTGDRADGEAG
jgi:hypothetical protein